MRAQRLPVLLLALCLLAAPALPARASADAAPVVRPAWAAGSDTARAAGADPAAAGAAEDEAADAQCGRDRRCRIERMKRLNRNRRAIRGVKTDEDVRLITRNREQREMPPRQKSPWGFDVRLTRLGLYGQYLAHPHLQLEVGISWISGYDHFDSGGSSVSADFEAAVADLQVTGLLTQGNWTLYGSAGFTYMWGDGNTWSWSREGEGGSSQARIEVHAFRLAAGLDALLMEQLRLRVGLVYQPHIYHQARIGDQYDPFTRDSLDGWLESSVRFHPEIRIGFAFHL